MSHRAILYAEKKVFALHKRHSRLIDSFSTCLVYIGMRSVLELLQRLMTNSQDDDCPIPSAQQTGDKAADLAREFIENYVDLSLPTETSQDNSKK